MIMKTQFISLTFLILKFVKIVNIYIMLNAITGKIIIIKKNYAECVETEILKKQIFYQNPRKFEKANILFIYKSYYNILCNFLTVIYN